MYSNALLFFLWSFDPLLFFLWSRNFLWMLWAIQLRPHLPQDSYICSLRKGILKTTGLYHLKLTLFSLRWEAVTWGTPSTHSISGMSRGFGKIRDRRQISRRLWPEPHRNEILWEDWGCSALRWGKKKKNKKKWKVKWLRLQHPFNKGYPIKNPWYSLKASAQGSYFPNTIQYNTSSKRKKALDS